MADFCTFALVKKEKMNKQQAIQIRLLNQQLFFPLYEKPQEIVARQGAMRAANLITEFFAEKSKVKQQCLQEAINRFMEFCK